MTCIRTAAPWPSTSRYCRATSAGKFCLAAPLDPGARSWPNAVSSTRLAASTKAFAASRIGTGCYAFLSAMKWRLCPSRSPMCMCGHRSQPNRNRVPIPSSMGLSASAKSIYRISRPGPNGCNCEVPCCSNAAPRSIARSGRLRPCFTFWLRSASIRPAILLRSARFGPRHARALPGDGSGQALAGRNVRLPPRNRLADSLCQRRLRMPAQLTFGLAAIEADTGVDAGLGEVVFDRECPPRFRDNHANEVLDLDRFAGAAIIERVGLTLPVDRPRHEVDEIADIKQVARLLALSPDDHAAILRGHCLGDRGAENMAAFEVELVVWAVDVGMAYDRVPGHAQAGEEFAHLLDVDLGPPAGEIARVNGHVGIPVRFPQR